MGAYPGTSEAGYYDLVKNDIFASPEYIRAFLEGQNPHLDPDCQSRIVNGRPVYNPNVLRELARDLSICKKEVLDRVGELHIASIYHFFKYLRGTEMGLDPVYVARRILRPRIHLPHIYAHMWGIGGEAKARTLVKEIYSFIDVRMQRAGLSVPDPLEKIEGMDDLQTEGIHRDETVSWMRQFEESRDRLLA